MTSLTRTVAPFPPPLLPAIVLGPRHYAISGPNGPRLPDRQPTVEPDIRHGEGPPPRADARQTPPARPKNETGDGGGSGAQPGLNRMWRMFIL